MPDELRNLAIAEDAPLKSQFLHSATGVRHEIIAEERIKNYYRRVVDKTFEQYEIAEKAREKGKDVELGVECTLTTDLADKCETIIGPVGVAKRYREIYAETKDRLKTMFVLFEEIITGKLGKIPDREKRLEQAVKTVLVLLTEGVVVAPLDGVPKVKISRNLDGTEYVDVYFAGPIRAAGGTSAVMPLILGDYARRLMSLDRYKPTGDEIERYVEEVQIYDEIFTRQYMVSDDEVRKIAAGCPVCINGEPTEEREVAVHRNLERVPSNRIRGGVCLVIMEGVALKAMKIMGYARMLNLDWGWLEQIIKVSKGGENERKIEPNYTYLTRLAAGRPIFCYPSKAGGFRLRYGRGRNTGIMGKGVHPATMYALDEFIAVGTQAKVERPGKSAEMFPCDTIEGPIVKLKGGEVRQLKSAEEAIRAVDEIEEIIFLGDCLVSYGDFRKSAHPLMPAGYCEEWWALELRQAVDSGAKTDIDLEWAISNVNSLDCFTAVEISMQLGIPLHPKFTHYYGTLGREELVELINIARKAEKGFDVNLIVSLSMRNSPRTKELLEKIGLPHRVEGHDIVVGREFAYPFLKTMGGLSSEKIPEEGGVFEILSRISGIAIRDKGGTFIGMRMGRPEAARPRKMAGNPHTLFPVGLGGGSTRSISKAMEAEKGEIEVEAAMFLCGKCGGIAPYPNCPDCNARGERVGKCPRCGGFSKGTACGKCGYMLEQFTKRDLGVSALMEKALKNLGVNSQGTVKGVRGLINENKIVEPLEKGILRAQHDLHIFRDATIRYELLNAPLTHFKPCELGISAKTARELGYKADIEGRELISDEQLVELFPQDIVINEEAGDFLVRVSQFIDDELERFYGLKPYYKLSSREGLVGNLLLALAPHTSAAVAGRVIGYTKARVCFAHPFFHLAKRRNADGDQDSVMLMMDVLLNFSQQYLPVTRGGRMDAPLVFSAVINPTEIDDEAYEIETCSQYPLELYEKCQNIVSADAVQIPQVRDRLGKPGQYTGINFTHNTSVFDGGPKISRYVQLETMEEKIMRQARLQGMIRSVEKKDALERVLLSHFLPDIVGNARAFSRQTFRCTNCNTKYRRIPLSGKCTNCRKGNLILTIAEGSVRKYLKIAREIITKYGLSSYLMQRIDLIEQEVNSIFVSDSVKQQSLAQFV